MHVVIMNATSVGGADSHTYAVGLGSDHLRDITRQHLRHHRLCSCDDHLISTIVQCSECKPLGWILQCYNACAFGLVHAEALQGQRL